MKLLVLAIAILGAEVANAADSKCARTLTNTPTENFIAYVTELNEQRIIEDADLFALTTNITNPIPSERAATNTSAAVARTALAELIAKNDLDTAEILIWAQSRLKKQGIIQKSRAVVKNETKTIEQKMEFYPIPPGRFFMRFQHKSNEIILTHSIEVMSTPVTQKMWLDLMGENPSHFKSDNSQNHPVENITWWSAAVFANRLSKKCGFKPAYDLSGMKPKKNTKAENGSLDYTNAKFKIKAPNGDIYDTDGYRLPTEAEQEYLLKGAGTVQGNQDYFFGNSVSELADYAWYQANSDGTTHPVAQLRPISIHGNEFYDLYGNVNEWGHDSLQYSHMYGTNVVGKSVNYRSVRGGSWKLPRGNLQSRYQQSFTSHLRSNDRGFRLVRTIK